ncbi:MAG: hypothetical protein GF375_01290 [Candidatus Omnitrophica bacterium]|nr:hypothetical protein [Candidatus Omnitrophota bacterium]MBD3268764.1 hypothetical protein [Candidatus Omnitrophota bacterium]
MYYPFILGKAIAVSLPRRVVYFLAKIIAIIHCYTSPGDREAVEYNLSPLVEGREVLKKKTRDVFINFAYYLADFFRQSKLSPQFIEKHVEIIGLQHLDRYLGEGKGVIALTAHLGNYELGGVVTSMLGYPLSVIALSHRDERTNIFFDVQRRICGLKVIPIGMALKRCISVLRRGEMLAMLGDRDFSLNKKKFRIFDRYAYLPRGAAYFASKTRAHILPSFFIRKGRFDYKLIFEKAITHKINEKFDENEVIKEYIKVLERYLKKYPEQWFLFEKYWLLER